MTPDFRAGMMKAAEIASAASKKRFAEAETVADSLDRITAKGLATGMGAAAIEILTACESEHEPAAA